MIATLSGLSSRVMSPLAVMMAIMWSRRQWVWGWSSWIACCCVMRRWWSCLTPWSVRSWLGHFWGGDQGPNSNEYICGQSVASVDECLNTTWIGNIFDGVMKTKCSCNVCKDMRGIIVLVTDVLVVYVCAYVRMLRVGCWCKMICFFNRGVISYRETGAQIYDCYSDVARKLWKKECQRSPEAGVKVVDIVIVVPKTDVTRCEIVLCEGRRGHQLVKDLKLNNQDNRQWWW